MSTQNLIIFKFVELYHILKELSLDLNFQINFANTENSLNEKVKNLSNYLVLSHKKTPDTVNKFILKCLFNNKKRFLNLK